MVPGTGYRILAQGIPLLVFQVSALLAIMYIASHKLYSIAILRSVQFFITFLQFWLSVTGLKAVGTCGVFLLLVLFFVGTAFGQYDRVWKVFLLLVLCLRAPGSAGSVLVFCCCSSTVPLIMLRCWSCFTGLTCKKSIAQVQCLTGWQLPSSMMNPYDPVAWTNWYSSKKEALGGTVEIHTFWTCVSRWSGY